MLKRSKITEIIQILNDFAAVVLVGPRQSGKTTLAKTLTHLYYDLELEGEKLRLDLDWPHIIANNELVILDEAQSYPEIFPRIRAAIDSRRSVRGRFLLLGSVAPSLMHKVSESLAGRAAVLELMPFNLAEVGFDRVYDLWRFGGYPEGGILNEPARYPLWQENYLRLITQRDLPNLGLPAKPLLTERLLKMIAAVHAQEWNASKIGASLGINYQTVNSYLQYLHGAFLTQALSPFEANLKKRIVKHPKIYMRDSGLLHALLGVGRDEDLFAKPWIGASWEGFVIEQILSALDSTEGVISPHFLRTGEAEIDLIFRYRGLLWAFEIKLTTQPTREHTKGLRALGPAIGAARRILVHGGEQCHRGDEYHVLSLQACLEDLRVFGDSR
jgi:predicted AAA+ superfamily ATPase